MNDINFFVEQKVFSTSSAKQTHHLGIRLANAIVQTTNKNGARVLALQGDLGSGKTTFVQGFATGLGVKEKVLSPTFVILKSYALVGIRYKNFYHIDCYRIEKAKELLDLNWKGIVSNSSNIILIEWPEHVEAILSQDVLWITFETVEKKKRRLLIRYGKLKKTTGSY